MSNLVPALTLFFIGYPLGRVTIRATLVGWFLILVAITQFVLSRWFRREGGAVTVWGRRAGCERQNRGVQATLKQFLNEAPK